MGCLTSEQIKQVDDLERMRVDTPKWGGHVFLRQMAVGEESYWLERFHAFRAGEADVPVEKIKGLREDLAIAFVVDEEGKQLFTEDAAEWLCKKHPEGFEAILKAFVKLNGWSKKSHEDLAKNSKSGRKAALSTTSLKS